MEKVIRWTSLQVQERSVGYWSKKTPQERLAAIEHLREPRLKSADADQGLQRFCRFVERTSR